MLRSFKFYQGQTVDIDEFVRSLITLGYKREARVAEEGDCASRRCRRRFSRDLRTSGARGLGRECHRLDPEFFSGDGRSPLGPRDRDRAPEEGAGAFQARGFHPDRHAARVLRRYPEGRLRRSPRSMGSSNLSRHTEKVGRPAGAGAREHMVIKYKKGRTGCSCRYDQLHLVQKYISLGNKKDRVIYQFGVGGRGNASSMRARNGRQDMAADCWRLQAAPRSAAAGFAFRRTPTGSRSSRRRSPTRRRQDQLARHRRGQARHGSAAADGPAGLRRRRLRQDRGGDARRVQGGDGRQAGGGAGADDGAGRSSTRTFSERLADYPVTVEMLSRFRTPAEQKRDRRAAGARAGRHRHRHAPAARSDVAVQGPGPGRSSTRSSASA